MIRIIDQPVINENPRHGFYVTRRIDAEALAEDDIRRYHARDDIVTEYLHLDGQWRLSTLNQDTGQYSGYYKTREQAQRVMECY
jgi:hypothetical protein